MTVDFGHCFIIIIHSLLANGPNEYKTRILCRRIVRLFTKEPFSVGEWLIRFLKSHFLVADAPFVCKNRFRRQIMVLLYRN